MLGSLASSRNPSTRISSSLPTSASHLWSSCASSCPVAGPPRGPGLAASPMRTPRCVTHPGTATCSRIPESRCTVLRMHVYAAIVQSIRARQSRPCEGRLLLLASSASRALSPSSARPRVPWHFKLIAARSLNSTRPMRAVSECKLLPVSHFAEVTDPSQARPCGAVKVVVSSSWSGRRSDTQHQE